MENDRSNKDFRSPGRGTAVSGGNKSLIITIGIALTLLIGLWIWKSLELNNFRKEAETQQEALRTEARKQIMLSHEEHLKLLTKPFVWAVRTEMMQGNLSQVNLYLNDMVREKNFQRIAISDAKGMIVSSTNKKDEGRPFSSIASQANLEGNSTLVENLNDSVKAVTTPIMGFNNRLGTLYIQYAVPSPALR